MKENIYINDHPLIQHKISILRDKNTSTNEFRRLVEEIAMLMGFESLRDLRTKTGCSSGTSCRPWHGQWNHYAGSFR